MKRGRFSEEQIVGILKAGHKNGIKVYSKVILEAGILPLNFPLSEAMGFQVLTHAPMQPHLPARI